MSSDDTSRRPLHSIEVLPVRDRAEWNDERTPVVFISESDLERARREAAKRRKGRRKPDRVKE